MTGNAGNRVQKIRKIIATCKIFIVLLTGVSCFYFGVGQLRSNEVFQEKPEDINKINLKNYLNKMVHLKGFSQIQFPDLYISSKNNKYETSYYPLVYANALPSPQTVFYAATQSHALSINDIKKMPSAVFKIESMNSLSPAEKEMLMDSYLANNEGVLIRVVEYKKYWWCFLVAGLAVFMLGIYMIICRQVRKRNLE